MIHAFFAIGFVAVCGLGAGAEEQPNFAPTPRPPETLAEDAARPEPSVPSLPPAISGQEALSQAVALASSGRTAEARNVLAAVAAAGDPQLAALAHYNLGCLAAGEARELFGNTPDELPPATRQQGLALLADACEHFRQCLEHDPQHADARHNLELIRLWIGAHRQLWRSPPGAQAGPLASPKPPAAPGGKPKPKPAAPKGAENEKQPGAKAAPPGAAGKTQPPGAARGSARSADPLRQYAEDLMAKVRQRIHDRRQREQSRLLPRWTQGEEKDW